MNIQYAEYRMSITITNPEDENYRMEITSYREDFINKVVDAINSCYGEQIKKGYAVLLSITPNSDKFEELNQRREK